MEAHVHLFATSYVLLGSQQADSFYDSGEGKAMVLPGPSAAFNGFVLALRGAVPIFRSIFSLPSVGMSQSARFGSCDARSIMSLLSQ